MNVHRYSLVWATAFCIVLTIHLKVFGQHKRVSEHLWLCDMRITEYSRNQGACWVEMCWVPAKKGYADHTRNIQVWDFYINQRNEQHRMYIMNEISKGVENMHVSWFLTREGYWTEYLYLSCVDIVRIVCTRSILEEVFRGNMFVLEIFAGINYIFFL